MEMKNNLFDCVYGRMIFGRRVDIATIEIYTVGIDTVMTTSYSIRVENRKDIKYEVFSKSFCTFAGLC
jgi:hypothetical protein